jgi:HEAT repeat protein
MTRLSRVCLSAAVLLVAACPGASQDEGKPDYTKKSLAEWIKALHCYDDSNLRAEARAALGPRGPYAKGAVPALIEAFKDDKISLLLSDAPETLADYGPAVVPTLLRALKRPEISVREGVVCTLGQMGYLSADVFPNLIAALKDPAPEVRAVACRCLCGYPGDATGALRPLSAALSDKDDRVREEAANALAWHPRGRDDVVIPALISALKDKCRPVRQNAALALGRIGPAAKNAVPALLDALRDKRDQQRWIFAKTLGEIGPAAKSAVPALIDVLTDPTEDAWENAAVALGEIGPDAAGAAVPALVKLAGSKRRQTADAAIVALGKIGPAAKEAVPTMIEALQVRDPLFTAMISAEALGRVGPGAKAAIPALMSIVGDRKADQQLRKPAALAVIKIDPEFAAKHEVETAYLTVRLGKVPSIRLAPRKPMTEEQTKRIRSLIAKLTEVKHGEFGITAPMKFPPLLNCHYWQNPLFTRLTPASTETLRSLIQCGPDALPFLLDALENRSATGLIVLGPGLPGGAGFGSELPGNHLIPIENRVLRRPREKDQVFDLLRIFDPHPAAVGDICCALIGEIVGRHYQPVVVSLIDCPVESKQLRGQMRAIWSSNNPRKRLLDSLLVDYATEGIYNGRSLDGWSDGSDFQTRAAARLLYYFPDETVPLIAARLRSLDVRHPSSGEEWMRRDVKNGVETLDFIRAVAWSRDPRIQQALAHVEKATDDPHIRDALQTYRK